MTSGFASSSMDSEDLPDADAGVSLALNSPEGWMCLNDHFEPLDDCYGGVDPWHVQDK